MNRYCNGLPIFFKGLLLIIGGRQVLFISADEIYADEDPRSVRNCTVCNRANENRYIYVNALQLNKHKNSF